MTFAFLVIFAHEAVESRAVAVLGKAGVEVGVEFELAGEGRGSLRRAHASNGEGAEGVLVAEGQEIGRMGAEKGHYHVTCDAPFMIVGAAEDTGQAAGQAGVGGVSLER